MYPRDLKRGDLTRSVLRLLPGHQHSKRWKGRAGGRRGFSYLLLLVLSHPRFTKPAGGTDLRPSRPQRGPYTGRGARTAGLDR